MKNAKNVFPFQPVTNAQLRDLIVELAQRVSEIHYEIRSLRTEMRHSFMATQQDIDALTAQVTDLGASLSSDVTAIQDEITALQSANPGVDVSALQAAVQSLSGNVDAVTALAPAAPAPVDPNA